MVDQQTWRAAPGDGMALGRTATPHPRGGTGFARLAAGLAAVAVALLACLPGARAQSAGAPPAAADPAAARVMSGDLRLLQQPVPTVFGRLRAADIGLVVNTRDPYSVAVGAYYAERRGLQPQQVLKVDLPVQPVLSPAQFDELRAAIDRHFGFSAQALALAWTAPYAVQCNSLPGALALGFDAALCANSCLASRPSPYANSRSTRPYGDQRMRLSMQLAARSVEEAKAMIDRGVASDGSLAAGIAAPQAAFVTSGDAARNVRAQLYPAPQVTAWRGIQLLRAPALAQTGGQRLILLQVGSSDLEGLPERGWLPGALADHLTSYGGDLLGGHGQATALRWITAGATASHGSVSEPCNHLHKFPHPQWLLGHYAQGATAIEAYWKSVMWPQQSLFIGEPLAAPFAPVPAGAPPAPPRAPS
jgi:uncharacterized protein (TIGR03790 family)